MFCINGLKILKFYFEMTEKRQKKEGKYKKKCFSGQLVLFFSFLHFGSLIINTNFSHLAPSATCNLFNAVGVHVEQHAAVDDAAPELKQAVERESSDIRLAPPLPTILHVFLEFQPPAGDKTAVGSGPLV